MQKEIRKYGTERCERLLKLTGNPDSKLKIVHIAGTNGKGSTAEYISSVLVAAGKKTGTFTSPQVFCHGEQFRVDRVQLTAEKIRGYIDEVKKAALNMRDEPSPFEIETAAAILAFYKEGCEYAVIECGLGGRDDATNAISKKEVAVITSVSLEHTAELGPTLKDICLAKSGIIRNCPVVVPSCMTGEAKRFFGRFDPVIAGEGLTPLASEDGEDGQRFRYKGAEYRIKMLGEAQLYNAATAVEVCRLLGIEERYISEGLGEAELAGRIQIIKRGGRTFILDGAHNPGAAEALSGFLKGYGVTEGELVFGCLSDKDADGLAEILSPHFIRAVLFEPDSPRAMPLKKMLCAFSGRIDTLTAASVGEALDKTEADTVAVCGSFTILKEAEEWINRRR